MQASANTSAAWQQKTPATGTQANKPTAGEISPAQHLINNSTSLVWQEKQRGSRERVNTTLDEGWQAGWSDQGEEWVKDAKWGAFMWWVLLEAGGCQQEDLSSGLCSDHYYVLRGADLSAETQILLVQITVQWLVSQQPSDLSLSHLQNSTSFPSLLFACLSTNRLVLCQILSLQRNSNQHALKYFIYIHLKQHLILIVLWPPHVKPFII